MDSREILAQLETLHPDAFGWAVSCCAGDRRRAEDVLQSAYLRVASGAARFEGRSTVKTWWFGVIRWTASEDSRRARRWLSFLDRWRAEPDPINPMAPLSPEDSSESDVAALQGALRALSERQREALHLVFYQKLSVAEAAAVMGVGVGSARQHYERGKRRLREILTPLRTHHE